MSFGRLFSELKTDVIFIPIEVGLEDRTSRVTWPCEADLSKVFTLTDCILLKLNE